MSLATAGLLWWCVGGVGEPTDHHHVGMSRAGHMDQYYRDPSEEHPQLRTFSA